MNVSWFDGHMLALLFIIPTAVFLGAGLWNAHSTRRWQKRHPVTGTVHVQLRADTTGFTDSIAAANARTSEFYKRLDQEGRNDRANVTRPRGVLPHCDPDCPPNGHTANCDRRYHQ